jgi:hypothetical protein
LLQMPVLNKFKMVTLFHDLTKITRSGNRAL